MVKSNLISKKPKKLMNPMEAYRKKNKDKEKAKHKKDKFVHKDSRNKAEESKQTYSNVPPPPSYNQQNNNDDDDDDFEGQDDLLELNSDAVQKILQAKQNMREKRYDDVSVQSSIQDLMQTFGRKQPATKPEPRAAQPTSQPSYHAQPTNARSEYPAEHNKPVFLPSAVPQQPQNTVKSTVGDKRTQKRQGAEGSLDPFMMTTMQGDYNPTIRNKPKQAEAAPVFDPMTGSYHSSAPGAFQAVERAPVIQKPVDTGPIVIMKEAALTSAPLRSQMNKEKSSLVPVNVVRKKVAKVENEAVNQPNPSTLEIGIQNVTNVPAPKISFAMPPSIQQNTGQNDLLSAFLQDISKLDE